MKKEYELTIDMENGKEIDFNNIEILEMTFDELLESIKKEAKPVEEEVINQSINNKGLQQGRLFYLDKDILPSTNGKTRHWIDNFITTSQEIKDSEIGLYKHLHEEKPPAKYSMRNDVRSFLNKGKRW